jgi:hypothetical protein
MRNIAKQLALLFAARGYTWKFDEAHKVPTEEDMDQMLAHIKDTLDKNPGDGVQLEIGRLIVRRDEGHLDVYVYFGELNE